MRLKYFTILPPWGPPGQILVDIIAHMPVDSRPPFARICRYWSRAATQISAQGRSRARVMTSTPVREPSGADLPADQFDVTRETATPHVQRPDVVRPQCGSNCTDIEGQGRHDLKQPRERRPYGRIKAQESDPGVDLPATDQCGEVGDGTRTRHSRVRVE